LIERFAAELTRVGGHLFRAESFSAASDYLEQLALAERARRVVGWDLPLIDEIARFDRLERIGVEFLRDRVDEDRAEEAGREFVKAAIDSQIGITTVDYALAEAGTLVLISGAGRARSASLVPPVHVAVVEAQQIISGLDDLFPLLAERGDGSARHPASAITFITGPSRTADIELTLVVGVHGPQQLHVILLTET
jgi:L-lactate dehydrogenase complex protein LldG